MLQESPKASSALRDDSRKSNAPWREKRQNNAAAAASYCARSYLPRSSRGPAACRLFPLAEEHVPCALSEGRARRERRSAGPLFPLWDCEAPIYNNISIQKWHMSLLIVVALLHLLQRYSGSRSGCYPPSPSSSPTHAQLCANESAALRIVVSHAE